MTRYFMDRRQFIKSASMATLAAAIPFGAGAMNDFNAEFGHALVLALIDAQNEAISARVSGTLDREDRDMMTDNLVYAFETIHPQTHDEAAFVVACGRRYPCHEYPEEYMRRKRGEEPLMPDHPIFVLRGHAMPDTRRMLVFTEQVDCLFKELILWRYLINGCRKEFVRKEINLERFTSFLRSKYRNSQTSQEKQVIFNGIWRAIDYTESYVRCSSIVNRAIRKTGSLHI